MIKIYEELIQGSDEWLAVRCGLLTASEMKLIIAPKLKVADNDKTRTHLYELAAQRITGYTEPQYISDSMLRGKESKINRFFRKRIERILYPCKRVLPRWKEIDAKSPQFAYIGPDEDEMILATTAQQKRRLIDSWEDNVLAAAEYVSIKGMGSFSTNDVFEKLDILFRDRDYKSTRRISGILQQDGYVNIVKSVNGKSVRVWTKE